MNTYHQQLHCPATEIDLAFWKTPEGVAIPDDELNFLLVPDAVEAIQNKCVPGYSPRKSKEPIK
jgi:hypothetical protein